MKKLHTIWSANMDQSISAHISMCYFSSIPTKHYRHLEKLYLRVGRLVVSITPSHEESVHSTLRNTLTAIVISQEYIQHVPFVRSHIIRETSLNLFLRARKKRYMKLPLNLLMKHAAKSLAMMSMCIPGGRLSAYSTQNVKDLIHQLIANYLSLIQYYELRKELINFKK